MARILIHGSGGREHAQAKLLRSQGHEVAIYPGNFGSRKCGFPMSLPRYDLEIFSMDQDLVDGKADVANNAKIVFGPTKRAAQLEGSKIFCKQILGDLPTGKIEIIRSASDI